MKIKIDKVETKPNFFGETELIGYRADFIELSGSPTVGTGKTEGAAVATLFIRNYDKLQRLNMDYLEINGEPYEDYFKRD